MVFRKALVRNGNTNRRMKSFNLFTGVFFHSNYIHRMLLYSITDITQINIEYGNKTPDTSTFYHSQTNSIAVLVLKTYFESNN